MIENLFWLGFVGAALSLSFAFIQARHALSYPEGNETMVKIAAAIREGANAFIRRQYTTVVKFFAVMFVVLLALSFFGLVNRFVPFAFLTGGCFTSLSGIIGMKVATSCNGRTANAANDSLNKGLRVAFSAGSVMGFTVAGLGLLDITAWFTVLRYVFHAGSNEIATTMVMFGIGVCCVAMFARLGGGIFTKAADVGADLVGKVEAGIPEDDPRNPATIADNVGDNVGDVAGMGADLYESYAHAIIATFALGAAAGYGFGGIMLPIFLAAVGVVASLIGTFFVRTEEKADQKTLLRSLHMGTFLAGGLAAAAALPITLFVANSMGGTMAQNAWGIFGTIIIGIIAGFLIGHFTEYYTSDTHAPTRHLAESSETGVATLMIGGLSLGMKASVGPVLTIAISTIISFALAGGYHDPYAGLYGIGLAAVGMLATLGIMLATDAFGPVADNAGGIAQMAKLPEEVRERTDALDALGNTTAATGKGFAIGSTTFTSLALLVSYVAMANTKMLEIRGTHLDLTITNPSVLIGLFCGAVIAFLFAALTIAAVHRAAKIIVIEVRRQFREIEGLIEGETPAEYGTCVDLCARNALREMVVPAVLSFMAPLAVGFVLGAAGVIGCLVGIIVIGFSMALFMLAAGGAWDNAKKYIEAGNLGGKGSDNHKAAVIGDTVGDPLKDTAGPCFNILITLACTVSIVFIDAIIRFSIL